MLWLYITITRDQEFYFLIPMGYLFSSKEQFKTKMAFMRNQSNTIS